MACYRRVRAWKRGEVNFVTVFLENGDDDWDNDGSHEVSVGKSASPAVEESLASSME